MLILKAVKLESLQVCNDDHVLPVDAVSLMKGCGLSNEVVNTCEDGSKTVKVDGACETEMLEVKEACCETD